MKKIAAILSCLTVGLLSGCFDKPKAVNANGVLFRSHWIGMNEVARGTNAPKLKEVWGLPASQELRKQALDKLAKTPFQLWRNALPQGAIDNTSLLRPLLDDLINSETYIELKGPSSDFHSTLGVQLDSTRSVLWHTNLLELLAGWKFSRPQALSPQTAGWTARGKDITVQLQNEGKWLLLRWSVGKNAALRSLSSGLEKTGYPDHGLTDSMLKLYADLPSLGRWIPLLSKHKLPPINVLVSPSGEYLRTEARVSLSEPLSWKFQPWQVPTNLISDPLVSFTVAQGIEPLFKLFPGFSDLGMKKMPAQISGWAQAQSSFRSFWASPMDQASNVLRQIAPQTVPFVKKHIEQPPGDLIYVTNASELRWRGMPFVAPILKAASDGGKDYLLVGLVPLPAQSKRPPKELFAQLQGRNDLLYYDWEITEARLLQSRGLYQVLDMVHLRPMAGTNDPSFKWFDQAAPRLGNSVTEMSMTSRTELKVVRKSHIGFTGFELATMMRWLDSPNFPLKYEPRPSIRNKNVGPLRPVDK